MFEISKIKKEINISGFNSIYYFEFGKDFTHTPEKHDSWEMVYVDKGQVEVQSEKDTIVLKQGEIIFHKPNEFHNVKAHESAPNFFVISFDDKKVWDEIRDDCTMIFQFESSYAGDYIKQLFSDDTIAKIKEILSE